MIRCYYTNMDYLTPPGMHSGLNVPVSGFYFKKSEKTFLIIIIVFFDQHLNMSMSQLWFVKNALRIYHLLLLCHPSTIYSKYQKAFLKNLSKNCPVTFCVTQLAPFHISPFFVASDRAGFDKYFQPVLTNTRGLIWQILGAGHYVEEKCGDCRSAGLGHGQFDFWTIPPSYQITRWLWWGC